jgi:hypothetical protein
MSKWHKRIELLANVAILLVALLVVGVLVQKYFMPARPEPIAGLPVGSKVSLPDIDWAKNERTLLLVLKEDCRFCSASAPFYQRLARETTGRGNLRLVAVLPQPVEDGKRYLSGLGVAVDEVRQASPAALSMGATPTLILTDRNGRVAASWVGQLPPDKENEVLASLRSDKAPGG